LDRDGFEAFMRERLLDRIGMRSAIPKFDAAGTFLASGRDGQALVQGLPADVDAVYVGPDPGRTAKDVKALAAALIDRRLPSFSQVGRYEVEQGLFMGLNGPENAERLARAIAVNTDAILQGEAPGKLNYVFQRTADLVINAATAKAIDRPLSWAVLSEAELIGKRAAQDARKVNLAQVAREVRDRNLSLRANQEELKAAQASVRESFGAFLPALDGSISTQWTDPDAATGINPERSAAWSGTASQVILNEPAMAQLTINRRLRDATQFDNRTAILDIVQSASIAYLNLLRALATERIQRENLKVTRMELSQADVRQQIGAGGRSEVVRLQNQLATNRKSVIDAVAGRNVAEIELLRLLNQASEAPIQPEDVSLQSLPFMATGERLQRYMTGPSGFRVLRRFMAREALQASPELKATQARLAAQQRRLLSTKLALFVPQISLTAGVTHTFATGGAGTSAEAQAFFPENPFNWQVGLAANLRLFEGTARYARVRREHAETRSQVLVLEAQRIQVEAGLRSTLHQAGASYAGIQLQQDAADAADENLALIQEGYRRGKDNVITLVDAQNQALTGKLNATTAVYDFLIDLLEVQRSMGRFDLLMSEAEVEDFFQRLRTFAELKETDRE
ncbi:MAG: TolC family protein, partial [Myxococcota bacterium]